MATTAAWYFLQREKHGWPPLYDRYSHANRELEDTYVGQRKIVGDAQSDVGNSPSPGSKLDAARAKEPMRQVGREMLAHLERFKELLCLALWMKDGSGHEVVCYGYENGAFLLYDPNFPGQTIRWPFDPQTGFGRYGDGARVDGWYHTIDKIAFNRVGAFHDDATFERLFDRPEARYVSVQTTSVRVSGNELVMEGTVSGGLPKKNQAEPPTTAQLHVSDSKTLGVPAKIVNGRFRIVAPLAIFDALAGPSRRAWIEVYTKSGLFAGLHWLLVEGRAASTKAAEPAPKTRGIAGALGG